ncbi:FMN-binding protein [Clostridium sp. CCUG 7971]|uniref:FMN-binding protein n=1 Tax=Clostridium sp. CCUG 7971 TaxID=2811414 RepID=UPI001ABB2221|nr:FMN-binding protein [Clostridium sp. CCUG 7971]MBO3445489.1 FMN-binding protein [Clostridium sp. CCUG 7971]
MKRKVLVGLCASLLTLSLVGCSSTPKEEAPAKETPKTEETASGMKDGVYEAETKEADENGGKARVSVKVESGKIVEASYNEFTDDGDKRANEGYNKMMKEKSGTNPSEYEPAIEKQIVEAQSAEIDGVTGATHSSAKAKTLFGAALKNANEGKAEKEVVEVK